MTLLPVLSSGNCLGFFNFSPKIKDLFANLNETSQEFALVKWFYTNNFVRVEKSQSFQ